MPRIEYRDTWRRQAERLRWGPTINEPKDDLDALDYITNVLCDRDGPASLGQIYSVKMILWLRERARRRQEAEKTG